MQETVLEINLTNIRRNAEAFKKATDRFLYAVVKADAYGHGSVAVTNALYGVADGFAVALISEAVAIQGAACGKEILVFTPPTSEEDVVVAANNGFSLTVTDLRSARLVIETAEKYGLCPVVQLKVNSGMNRYGVYGSTLGKVCSILKRSGQVRVQGVYSHLYSHEVRLCESQRMRFLHAVKICRRYFPLARVHLASTYGAMLGDAYLFDGVRIGLGLYGYFPEGEAAVKLLPAMRGTAPCVARRKMLFGGAGYGTERTDLIGTEISVLRCGYADGFGRSAERSGLQPRLLGDFCMDVAIAEQRIEPGRRMVLFDDAKQLAQARGISVYEALCLMGLRAEKNYIYD